MNLDMFAVQWRKSSYSGGQGGACVELAALPDGIGVRDSKNPDAGVISMDRTTFRLLTEALKNS